MSDSAARPSGVTAAVFFDQKLPGFTLTAAHHATQFAYSALHDCVRGKTSSPRKELLIALQEWSYSAIPAHGIFISAAKTLGLPAEPSDARAA